MPSVRLRGLNSITKRLADGRRVTYWYAWKGGPRLKGEPGSPEFIASFAEAEKARKTPKKNNTLAGLVEQYRRAAEFTRLADSTRAEWGRWLDKIAAADIGSLTTAALNVPRCRSILLEWRDTYAKTPRAADYGAQVLSRTLAWAKGRNLIEANHFEKPEQLHRSSRAEQIWTPAEIDAFCAAASPEVGRALKLACYTGLRRGDLIALTWEQVGATAIVLETRKTASRAQVPLLPETTALLAEIGPRAKGHVLLNTRGKPWSADGLENRVIKAKSAAGIDKHLHDARGTFVTRLRLAGVTRDDIASVMGWDTDRVERILAHYVDNELVVRRIADRLNGNTRGSKSPN